MKKLLTILLVLFVFIANAQDPNPLPSITVKKLIAPNNPTFYYDQADSLVKMFKGAYEWTWLIGKSYSDRYLVPYNGANRHVNIPTGKQYQINGGSIIVDAISNGVTTTAPSQNSVFDALALKEPANANIQTHITNDADLSTSNELNTSVVFNKTNNKIEITDSGGTKSDTIEINQDLLINGYSGTINVITNPVAFNWPVAYSDTNYYLDIFPHYTETIDGKSVLIRNAVYDFIKTTTGFSLKLDTLAGVVEYRASRTINSETPANVVLQSDLTTTVGTPGLDTKIPTEKAVRTALSGVVVTETDPVYSAKFDLNGSVNGDLLKYNGTKYIKFTPNYLTSFTELDPIYSVSSWFSTTNNATNWNTSYTDRLKWDGGSTGLIAATGRTSLGGTTIGSNLFTLTNPSAVTFPRINADNTVSALTAEEFKTAIGAGSGGGISALDLVGYQSGEFSAASNSTGAIGRSGLYGSAYITSGGGLSTEISDNGPRVILTPSGSANNVVSVLDGVELMVRYSQLPLFSYKFSRGSTSFPFSYFFAGISNAEGGDPSSTSHSIGIRLGFSDTYLTFYNSNGTNSQITSSGISFNTTDTFIFVCEVLSSSIIYKLYDASYNLLSTATHTLYFPISNMKSVIYYQDRYGDKLNTLKVYSGKIILKK